MIEIKQITNVEELWKSGGAPTGNVLVDAMVEFLMVSQSNDLKDMADVYGVNRRLLQEAIPVFVGVTPHEMIRRWRVCQAIDLLVNTTESEESIAERCGFRNCHNLRLFIRRYHYTTVSALRKGTPRRNGNYGYDQNQNERRTIAENGQRVSEEFKKNSEEQFARK